MGMMLCLQIRQQLRIAGGCTQTIFTEAEKLLRESDYQEALKHVGSRKNMDRYESMMDFLFCEIFPRWRYRCFRYYDGEGKQLRFLLSKEEISRYDSQLVTALEVAMEALKEEWMVSWGHYRMQVIEKLAA